MADTLHPIQPGIPGHLGPGGLIATITGDSVTMFGQVIALSIQLAAVSNQVKAKLQTNLSQQERQRIKDALRAIALQLNQI